MYNDHRMAMIFSPAEGGDVPVTINDPSYTPNTFLDYFDVLMLLSSDKLNCIISGMRNSTVLFLEWVNV